MRVLDETHGELLPGWERSSRRPTAAGGAAAEHDRALRELAETATVDLFGALAANQLACQQATKAIPLLERALERQPEREDLARKLVAAYAETGQHGRAAEPQHGIAGG